MQNTLLALAASGLMLGAAQADTIKIGHAGPLTGPIAHIGKDGEYGARLAIEDANAAGIVIDGEQARFELVSEDDQADPRQATTAAQRLADEEVAGVIGHVTSGASIPASRIYQQAGIPVITSTSSSRTRAGYYPGADEVTTKLTVRRDDGTLLGAQIVGGSGAGKRIDTLATAIWCSMTVDDLSMADLSYAPPFSPVRDPVVLAAGVAARELRGAAGG